MTAPAGSTDNEFIRFGDFVLDRRQRHLLDSEGREISLTPRVFDTLLYLAKHPGQLVEKATLLEEIWPGRIVEENNLTQAISSIRRALGEKPREHRFIATVPGRGYRFTAQVLTSVEDAPGGGPDIESRSGESTSVVEAPPGYGRMLRYGLVLAAIIGLAFFADRYLDEPGGGETQARIALSGHVLVTRIGGNHRQPTLSPDGSFVAFVNDITGSDQIYVQNLASGGPIRITDIEGGASHPSWSPANDRILFHGLADGGIWSVGVFGEPAAKKIIVDGKNPAFSSRGETVVYEFQDEIRLADSDGGRQSSVPGVTARDWSFFSMYPRLSPDSEQIVFFRQATGPRGDYWIIPVSGGEAEQLTFDHVEGGRPDWAEDGFIYFPSERGGTRTIWRIDADDGTPEPVTSSVGQDDDPVLSRDLGRIVYVNSGFSTRFLVWDPASGERTEVFRSRFKSSFPRVSHNKSQVAFFQKSDPEEQIFLLDSVTWSATKLTEATRGEQRIMPRWAADDSSVIFYEVLPDFSWSLRAIKLGGGPSEELFREFSWMTNVDVEWSPTGDRWLYVQADPGNPGDAESRQVVIVDSRTAARRSTSWPIRFAPAWSPDGQFVLGTSTSSVIVCSIEADQCWTVFRQVGAESAGNDVQLGHYARWSEDGSRIYFNWPTDDPVMLELRVVNRDGSDPRPLFTYGPIDPLDGRFQVLSGDRILWNEDASGRRSELWMADISRSPD